VPAVVTPPLVFLLPRSQSRRAPRSQGAAAAPSMPILTEFGPLSHSGQPPPAPLMQPAQKVWPHLWVKSARRHGYTSPRY
jgi:hypothetical protein